MKEEKNTKSSEILVFGSLKYDLCTGQLQDDAGNIVRMRRQSADVLVVLGQHAGDIVSKEKLIEIIWPDVVTTDDSLVKCIADIRRVLGRQAVETFPKKGYRLQPTKVEKPKPQNTVFTRRVLIGGALGFLLLAGLIIQRWHSQSGSADEFIVAPLVVQDKSLAVLPFANLGGDVEIQYFSDGLSEDLITDLSKVPGLTVISSASSFDFPDAESGFKEIAEELGVRYLVRGTVRNHEDRFRINVSLVDPFDGFNLWAERFDRVRENPFDVQEEITHRIVDSLSLTLNTDKPASQRIDPDAYYMLLRGLEPLRERTVSGNVDAREYFERALALNPQYARAHASIAVTYGRETTFQDSREASRGSIETGLKAAVAAIQLDPNIPHAYLALGLLNLSIEEYDHALAAARHAIKLDLNYSDGYALLAEISMYGGDLEEGLVAIRRAKLLHPRHPPSYCWIEGHILYLLAKYDEAEPLLKKATDLDPKFLQGFITLAANYAQQDNMDEASSVLARAQSINHDIDPLELIEQSKYRLAERRSVLLESLRKVQRY